MRDAIDGYFSDDSPLSGVLPGFSCRPEQLEMARAVARAMANGTHLAIEAGAGTGKTLAYLVPALLSGRRVVIATATRTLQDQLYHRDLPVVCNALGRPAAVAQLKGRANYLCAYRLQRTTESAAALAAEVRRHLRLVGDWAVRTDVGDISEVGGVDEGADVWPLVTSTAENCLGSRCPDIAQCHVARARKRAAEADVAVVNHHLLLADMALRDDGMGRLLPGADVIVVDEAHRFPETAQGLFDTTLRLRQVEDAARDLRVEALQAGVLAAPLQQGLAALGEALHAVAVGGIAEGDSVAMSATPPALTDALHVLADVLEAMQLLAAECAPASAGLARCSERITALAGMAARVAGWQSREELCWALNERGRAVIYMSPLDASRQLGALLERQGCSWIFTSATLAVADDFSHFSRRLGLVPMETRRIDSPFDYDRCARLYLPAGLPAPDVPDYTERVVAAVEPVLQASRGRAFLLFTSRRAMQVAAELLASRDTGHTLLVQGTAPRSTLLREFARAGNAVLLGTATFWEGVDVRGPALVVVAIDRLPFASPGDPLLQARLEAVRRAGGDAFRDYQLPQAVLALRQGVGRLIRGYGDYGVVVLCDPRLTGRGYGRLFLQSLPPMRVVRTAAEACSFLVDWEQRQ